mmetsp:Transcript_28966/g.93393  ORF Transcript_28966/g.93393 Transcript_28966/m.93393 type:complete len:214 (-) Transcript_28966:747-1388(-)
MAGGKFLLIRLERGGPRASFVEVGEDGFQVVEDGGEVGVGNGVVFCELSDEGCDRRVVRVGDAREEVVFDLVVEAAVEEAQEGPPDVRGGHDLLPEEGRLLRGVVDGAVGVGAFGEVNAVEVVREEEEKRQVKAGAADGRGDLGEEEQRDPALGEDGQYKEAAVEEEVQQERLDRPVFTRERRQTVLRFELMGPGGDFEEGHEGRHQAVAEFY